MKKAKLISGIGLFLFASLISSCKKEKETADLDNESVDNETISSFVEKSMSVDEDAAAMRGPLGMQAGCNWQELLSTCAIVTESADTFPKTITIDYGTGCTGPHDITKSGIIMVELSDDMMNSGAIRTVTFDNFQINNTQITGSRVTTNVGANSSGQPMFERMVNTTLTRAGHTIMRNANEQITWISGFETEECGDNIFSVTGSGTCTRPNGTSRTRTITSPLIIDHSCGYIISGVVEITGPHGTGTMNFGDGTCDDIASVTRPNGNVQTIHLHQH